MTKISSRPLQLTGVIAVAFLLLLTVSTASCKYDKQELLFPNTVCDTTVVTYSVSVAPILSANCTRCHGGSTPSAGIKLDVYSGVKIYADNGSLLGAISHDPSFSPMPKNGPKMSDCNIAKIRKWIAAGSPNN
jgi:hypothetical protein